MTSSSDGFQQRVEDQRADAGRRLALGEHRVEGVEGAGFGELQLAALRRIRIDIVEMA